MKKPIMKSIPFLVAVAFFCLLSAKTSNDSPIDLPTYGITVLGESVTMPKEELEELLNSIPSVASCEKFRELRHGKDKMVTLTPTELLVLFLYSGTEDTVAYTQKMWQGQTVFIHYESGVFSISAVGYANGRTEDRSGALSVLPPGGSYSR